MAVQLTKFSILDDKIIKMSKRLNKLNKQMQNIKPLKTVVILNTFLFCMFMSLYIFSSASEFQNNIAVFSGFVFSGGYFTLSIICGIIFTVILNFILEKSNIQLNYTVEKTLLSCFVVLIILHFVLTFILAGRFFTFAIHNLLAAAAITFLYWRIGITTASNNNHKHIAPLFVIFMAVGVVAIIMTCSIMLQNGFATSTKDMGIFTNIIWRTSFDGQQLTMLESPGDHRAVHFQPIIYIIALFFKLFSYPNFLMIFQSSVVFISSVFIYKLAHSRLRDQFTSFIITAAFCISPYLFRPFSYDFHPEVIYLPAFLGLIYFAESKKNIAALVALLLALATKEEAGVYCAFACMFIYFNNKNKLFLVSSVVSLLYSLLCIKFIIPHFSPQHANFIDPLVSNLLSGNLNFLGVNPLGELLVLFLGFAFIQFFSISALTLIFLPPVLVHLIFYNSNFVLFAVQYAIFVIPAIFVAYIYSLEKFSKNNPLKISIRAISIYIFISQLFLHVSFTAIKSNIFLLFFVIIMSVILPFIFINEKKSLIISFAAVTLTVLMVFYNGYFKQMEPFALTMYQQDKKSINAAIATIPTDIDVPVIAQSIIVPHLCIRKYIWSIWDDNNIEEAIKPAVDHNFGQFYLLVNEHINFPTKEKAELFINSFIKLASQKGYKLGVIYNDMTTIVFHFYM